MKETRLELTGMTCDSCERIIQELIEENGAIVKGISLRDGLVDMMCDEEKLPEIKKKLAENGYVERRKQSQSDSENVELHGNPKRVIDYLIAILAGKKGVEVESKLTNYVLGSFLFILVLGGILYSVFNLMAILQKYLPIILLAVGTSVGILASYHHMSVYRKEVTCMTGMMMGMTVGMISGFMIGAIIGATNGMFIGSVVGMLTGMLLGVRLGRYCGVMGAMEGTMAGMMSGTMGAMLSVMMINDNLLVFMYILFGLCMLVLVSLSYMAHREFKRATATELKIGFVKFLALSAILSGVIIAIMIYGPKNGIVYPI